MTTYSLPQDVRPTIDTLHELRAQIRTELRDPGPYTLIVTPVQWHDVLREADRDRWYYHGAYVEGQHVDELRIMDFTIVRPIEIRPRGRRVRGYEIDYAAIDDLARGNWITMEAIHQAFGESFRPARPAPKTTHANWGGPSAPSRGPSAAFPRSPLSAGSPRPATGTQARSAAESAGSATYGPARTR